MSDFTVSYFRADNPVNCRPDWKVVVSMKRILPVIWYIVIAVAGNFIAHKLFHPPTQMQLAIIAGICLFYPVIRHPIIGVYLIFIVLPFIPFVRRLYYLIYTRPSVDPLIAVGPALIALTLIGLYFEMRARNVKDHDIRRIRTIIFMYFVYVSFRVFFYTSLGITNAVNHYVFFGPAVLLFFVGIVFAAQANHMKNLLIITVIIAIYSVLYGWKQVVFGFSDAEKLWFNSVSFTTLFIKGIARPFSIFQAPASFADYMLFGIIAVAGLFSWSKGVLRYALLLFVPLFFYGALITSVRSNWIGIVFSLILWVAVVGVRGTRKRITIIIAIVALFAMSSFLDEGVKTGLNPARLISIAAGGTMKQSTLDLLVTQRTSAISDPFQEHSLLSRIALWKYLVSLSVVPQYAIFGRGLGAINSDSLYFDYLAGLGYPGIIFIIWLTIYLIGLGFKALDTSKNQTVLAVARCVTIMNISLAIINLTGTHINAFPGDVYYWFWNGVLVRLATSDGHLTTGIPDNALIDNA